MDENNLDDFKDEKARLKEFYKNKNQSENQEEQQEQKKKKWFPILFKYGVTTFFFLIFIGFGVIIVDNYVVPDMINTRRLIMVPKLEGLSLDSASIKLEQRNLKVEILKKQFDRRTPKNVVLKQNPEVGKKIREKRTIYLTLSLGSEKVEVPEIVGKSLRAARIMLLNAGLNLGKIKYKFHESIPANTLITQSIKKGDTVNLGDKVDILISKGSENELLVPNLVGLELEEAKEILKQYHLQLGSLIELEDDTYVAGTVIGQFPSADEKIIKNSYVDLEIVLDSNFYDY